MPAGLYNLVIEQGETALRTITWEDEDGANPDLSSGWTASLVVSDRVGGTSLLELTEGSGITLAADGVVEVEFSAVQTAALTAGDGYWHLDLTRTATGRVYRILKGVARIEPGAV